MKNFLITTREYEIVEYLSTYKVEALTKAEAKEQVLSNKTISTDCESVGYLDLTDSLLESFLSGDKKMQEVLTCDILPSKEESIKQKKQLRIKELKEELLKLENNL